jgi:cytochrome c
MNTMEITKIVGALAGSLLIFLLIQFAGEGIFHVGTEAEVFQVALPEGEAEGEEAPAEEAIDTEALMAAADPSAGESVWRRCSACHTLEDGQNRVGPHLFGVVGRDIASLGDFSYSDTLAGLEGGWDYEHLFGFLADPQGYAPGTAMNFGGLSNPEERANVIAFIEQQGQ